jgi:hypothetical protein
MQSNRSHQVQLAMHNPSINIYIYIYITFVHETEVISQQFRKIFHMNAVRFFN